MRGALVVAAHALEEAFRRRVFVVVLVLTIAFLALYRFGAGKVFQEIDGLGAEGLPGSVDETTIAAATLLGLAMFGTLFLGACSASSSRSGPCAATPSAACCNRSSSVRSAVSGFSSAASWRRRRCAASTSSSSTRPRRC